MGLLLMPLIAVGHLSADAARCRCIDPGEATTETSPRRTTSSASRSSFFMAAIYAVTLLAAFGHAGQHDDASCC